MLQLSEQLSLSAQLQGMLVSPSKFSQPKAAARGLHCKDGGSAPRSKSSSLPAALCASSAAKPPPLPSAPAVAASTVALNSSTATIGELGTHLAAAAEHERESALAAAGNARPAARAMAIADLNPSTGSPTESDRRAGRESDPDSSPSSPTRGLPSYIKTASSCAASSPAMASRQPPNGTSEPPDRGVPAVRDAHVPSLVAQAQAQGESATSVDGDASAGTQGGQSAPTVDGLSSVSSTVVFTACKEAAGVDARSLPRFATAAKTSWLQRPRPAAESQIVRHYYE